ncbi:MAG TPA: UMP kinase [Clostridiales bacterium]|jgi:uridylate kinase|nr:UMP kinase [Clostridiales bacterium]
MAQTRYKRVLIKLSGEALAKDVENSTRIINFDFLHQVCTEIKHCRDLGTQIAIVIGAGNIWRGARNTGVERVRADHMGMLATTINALAMQDMLEKLDVPASVLSAIEMKEVAEPFTQARALKHLNQGDVVIFSCGTGCPYFSTDTAAVLRAAEMRADVILLAKNIDAVYTADPHKDPSAQRLEHISFDDVYHNKLDVIDRAAAAFMMQNRIPLVVFGLKDPHNIVRAVCGEKIGTLVD